MRYLRWGGDGEAVQPEKGSGVGNCLKCAQNPQRQVHALLGVLHLSWNYNPIYWNSSMSQYKQVVIL